MFAPPVETADRSPAPDARGTRCAGDVAEPMHRERHRPAGSASATHPSVCCCVKARGLPPEVEIELARLGSLVEREGPLPPERTVPIVHKAARSLADAPASGRGAVAGSRVHSLGEALFHALTGMTPVSGLPRSPSLFSPHRVPSALDAVVCMCLAPRRADQFSSPLEVAAALAALSFRTPGATPR